MTESIGHRGPDDQGTWIDRENRVALGHRRLSIVDLSPHGHQPMMSRDGRYVLSFNGEIYNHSDLRRELEADPQCQTAEGSAWRGHSDTETLVECIAAWGLTKTLKKCVGMFAIGLWDRAERRLQLARDRFGEKPLYYGWVGGDFLFASELKAIRIHPAFNNPICRTALRLYAARTYVPAPLSIYERLYKLEPGCILTIPVAAALLPLEAPPVAGRSGAGIELQRYWSYADVVREGLASPIKNEGDALEQLDQALSAAIKGQSVADVPVGAFLSGGIDSSTVVALYRKHSSVPVRTFSIGFEEAGFNEADHARAVARHFGTEHNELYLTVADASDVIPLLPAMYDEPFADSSQIPTHLVSRFARDQVKVAMSGDGADELFAGYNRHLAAPRLWDRLRRVPRPLRAAMAASLGTISPGSWSAASRLLGGGRNPHGGWKVQKGLRIAGTVRSLDDVYNSFLDEWWSEPSPVLGGKGPDPLRLNVAPGAPDAVRLTLCDAVTYLPDDILCKVDRAAMAVGLETRLPFLDHRLAAVAARIPAHMKIRGGKGKHILRQLLYRHAPQALFDRPKAGFAIPLGEWLRGPLRPWTEDLLDPRRMRESGFFDEQLVQRRWQQHLRGERDSAPAIWAILMFQAWHAEMRGT
jgi:asparagine synthase (glutamine-hydrolysing)